ncbi:MAG: hypothetical protein EXS05_09115 [Planctomycetaceae bacterium]|nr:hypothetical protein [Planctomycetaceae bacterium]
MIPDPRRFANRLLRPHWIFAITLAVVGAMIIGQGALFVGQYAMLRMKAARVKPIITSAFSNVAYPGDEALRGSDEGDEPFELERSLVGKNDWRKLDSTLLAETADDICFLSDEAFHFYLPAYLIADLDGRLPSSSLEFLLCHGLDDQTRNERVNPRRYGDQTWFETTRQRYALFSREEAAAIVAYLKFKQQSNDFLRDRIEQALRNFWMAKAGLADESAG